jgi:hypothetical protein
VSIEVTELAVIKTSLIQDNFAHAYHGMESVALQPTNAFLGTRGFILATATWQHRRVHDRVPATDPCNEPDESGTHRPILALYDPF